MVRWRSRSKPAQALASPKPTVLEDRPWIDPDLDAMADRLPGLPPDQQVELALEFLVPRRHHPERAVQALWMLAAKTTGALETLRQLVRRDDLDQAGQADALALLGAALVARAWEIRGSTRAAQVDKDAWAPFHAHLAESDDALQAALGLEPDHPGAAVGRLRTALDTPIDEAEFWGRFRAATLARSTLYPAHTGALNVLCRKWKGSDQAMLDFAHSVAANAPAGDPVVAVLPIAHVEFQLSRQMFKDEPSPITVDELLERDGPAMLAASRRWCGDGTRPVTEHPRNLEAHQLLGWGLQGFDDERARWHLEQGTLRIAQFPWVYLGDPVEVFLRTRYQLGLDR